MREVDVEGVNGEQGLGKVQTPTTRDQAKALIHQTSAAP